MLLKFNPQEITTISSRYQYPSTEQELINLRDGVMGRGHLTKSELQVIARWKSPRNTNVAKNSEEFVKEITQFAFATNCERARIEVLTLLDGVQWPTASVILHLFHKDPYPLLDFRALWSVSVEPTAPYNFALWWEYVEFCRYWAESAGVDMRTLDRALWQYSKENQGPS